LLPNINDQFSGSGPDLGAFEFGTALPHYGPRNDDESDGSGMLVSPILFLLL
jgi:hypothetical protein